MWWGYLLDGKIKASLVASKSEDSFNEFIGINKPPTNSINNVIFVFYFAFVNSVSFILLLDLNVMCTWPPFIRYDPISLQRRAIIKIYARGDSLTGNNVDKQ